MKYDTTQPEITAEQWVIYIILEDSTDYETADKWMDAITETVYQRDPGFSGIVGMKRGPLDVES